MKVPVTVKKPSNVLDSIANPMLLSLIAVGFIGSVWVLRGFRGKR
jgi:hypothetical protein